MKSEASDLDDSSDLWKKRWGHAIDCWLHGHAAELVKLIDDAEAPIPKVGRDFLSDLVAGKVNKGKGGRPTERHGAQERRIMVAVFRAMDGGQNRADAFEAVAPSFGLTDSEVRGVYEKVRAKGAGITYEKWISWGRPRFESSK